MASPFMVCLTEVETGKFRTFGSLIQASEFIGRSKQYLRSRLFDGGEMKETARGKDGKYYTVKVVGTGRRKDYNTHPRKPKNPENAKYAGCKPSQLCFDCARASGFCSWSKNFTPVEGWTAKPTKINHFKNKCGEKIFIQDTDSYHVLSCPLFIPDAPTKEGRREQRKILMEELVNERTSSV